MARRDAAHKIAPKAGIGLHRQLRARWTSYVVGIVACGLSLVAGIIRPGSTVVVRADAGESSGEMSANPGSPLVGVYRPEFPDDLTALTGYEEALGQHLSIVHWYVQWAGADGA